MNEAEMKKNQIRKEYLQVRKEIHFKEEKAKSIVQKVIAHPDYQKARVVALYRSMSSEVNTNELIRHALENGKIVVLPRVENEELVFYQITSSTEKLIKSRFGVEEPEAKDNMRVSKDRIDLVIVPGVCFDIEKSRMGFGKGYYDRFLKDMVAMKIGICFEEQVIKEELLPVSEYDVRMDQLITDICIYD